MLCLHFWQWLYLCGSIPEGCCRQALELHKCFQMHPVKVLLYFPASLMFRNKYWQCLFREFWSISEHVSSMLSLRLRERAVLSGDWTVQAWKPNLKKKEEETKALHATPAATTSITGRFFFLHTLTNPICKNSLIFFSLMACFALTQRTNSNI